MNDICVCAEPLEDRGLYPCGHALCLSCTLKKRVLMKDMNCPYCRSAAQEVAVVENSCCGFGDATEEFRRGHLRVQNDKERAKLNHILQFPCPECDEDCYDLKKLKKHLLAEHNKAVCDVCAKNEFNFSDEFVTFAPQKIKDHLKHRHIFCKYCRTYFYGTAEFSAHCKKVHVACDICERRDPEHPQYFEHYNQLRNHYQDKHYRCMEPECLANMHIVFGTAVELQKHMVEAHHMSPQAVSVDFDYVDQPNNLNNSNTNSANGTGNTGKGSQMSDDEENEEAKYTARLDIVSLHDQDKITKIRGANATFLARKVPVEIFIATYESVLKRDASFVPQITLLLKAFAKAHGSQMPPENLRSLNFILYQREQAELKQSAAEQEQRAAKSATYAQQSGSSKSQRPPPVAIQPINWGLNLPRSGGINSLAELPKLGSSRSTPSSHTNLNSRSDSGGSTARLASYASGSRPSVSIHDLPKLQKKSKPKPVPVARSASPAASLAQFHTSGLNSSGLTNGSQSGLNRPARTSPFTVPHVNGLSLNSSRASSASSSSSSLSSRGVQLNNLPTLPKAKKEEKKRQHNVIRLV